MCSCKGTSKKGITPLSEEKFKFKDIYFLSTISYLSEDYLTSNQSINRYVISDEEFSITNTKDGSELLSIEHPKYRLEKRYVYSKYNLKIDCDKENIQYQEFYGKPMELEKYVLYDENNQEIEYHIYEEAGTTLLEYGAKNSFIVWTIELEPVEE